MPKRGRRTLAQWQDRHQQIINLLKAEGALSITALAERFDCSPATIRRDIAILQPQMTELKKYHGVVAVDGAVTERHYQDKVTESQAEKEHIAEAVCGIIADGSVVGLNGGTTTMAVAREIVGTNKQVTVVTNAINVAFELSHSDVTVVVIGGVLRTFNFETTGLMAVHNLESLHLDWVILGANGIHPVFGVSTVSEPEAAIGAAFARHADQVMVVVDHTKLGHQALHRMLGWTDVSALASDVAASPVIAGWRPGLPLELYHQTGLANVWRVMPS